MKKKILSLVLVIAMLASMLVLAPVSGATESKATLEFSNAVGVQGDTVTVDFKVTTETLQGIQFMFEYDAERLSFAGFEEGIAWTTAYGTVYPADLTTNKTFKYFTDYGPYTIPSLGLTTVADLSAGEVIATLTFTIKDDAPLGDAYVRFAPLTKPGDAAVQVNTVDRGDGTYLYSEDITFVDGAISVLPEGYSLNPTLPVHYLTQEDLASMNAKGTFEYDVNDDEDGWIITKFSESLNGIVVFPEEIYDFLFESDLTLPVVGIATFAVNANATAAGFVIPASVVEISTLAFYKCAATDYYVMNPDCIIGAGALGADATLTDGALPIKKGPFVMNVATGAATIHGVAGSTAEEYAAQTFTTNISHKKTKLNWVANTELPTENTLKFNGNTYYFPAGTEVTLPGMMEDANGNLVVAWNAGAVGSKITITEDIVLEPAKTIAKPQTSTEVGLKLADSWKGLSMRFKATFGVADYDTLVEVAGEGGSVALGMLITPARYVSYAGAFTKEALAEFKVGETTYALGEDAYVDVALNGYFSKTDDEYTFAARLQNFSDTTLAKNPDFAAVMYATVTTADGATFTVYGDFNFAANNSVLDVAKNTSTEGQTDTIKGAVANLIKKLNGEEV